ncbi:MAG TPA: GxxExxY protein [Gammaproteobacteria bacterium]|nr:GxxExxY protein [Gammaproteobacteria bacterium]
MRNTFEPSNELDFIAKGTIGAAIEVHKQLGPGYLESLYEEALAIELNLRNIKYKRQYKVNIQYKNNSIGDGRLDLLIENKLVVELKTVDILLPLHKAQVISYLKATNLHLGLLINFNTPLLKHGIKRIIYSN